MSKKQQGKSPAFQFYAQDWLADFKVRCLTYEQKGIYIELLAMSWIEPITSDIEKLSIALRLPSDTVGDILHTFFIEKDGCFYNKKLESYRQEKIKFIKKMSEAGKKGNAKRWSGTNETTSSPSDNQAIAKHRSLSSTSTSSITITNNIQEIVKFFEESVKTKVLVISDRRKKHIGARLKVFSLEDIKKAIYNFSTSEFYTGENDRGWKADLDWIIKSDEQIEKGLKLEEQEVKNSGRATPTQERSIKIEGMYFTERERNEIKEKGLVILESGKLPRFKEGWKSEISFKL
jgi:uncharacterized protein YdaU (DUF1376 family)